MESNAAKLSSPSLSARKPSGGVSSEESGAKDMVALGEERELALCLDL